MPIFHALEWREPASFWVTNFEPDARSRNFRRARLYRLDGVGQLHQLARGDFGIGERLLLSRPKFIVLQPSILLVIIPCKSEQNKKSRQSYEMDKAARSNCAMLGTPEYLSFRGNRRCPRLMLSVRAALPEEEANERRSQSEFQIFSAPRMQGVDGL